VGALCQIYSHTATHHRSFFELLSFFLHRTHSRHVGFLIPCLILRSTWTERNNTKHRDIIFSCAHMIFQVDRHLSLSLHRPGQTHDERLDRLYTASLLEAITSFT
ncbi:Unknown protein, partial [Striga hermonthica]